MATLNQVRTRIDNWLAEKWPTLVARQDNFFANRGRYWQGLRSHTIIPEHSNSTDGDAVPDRLNQNPQDAFDNWVAAFPEWDGVAIPCAIQIDVYDGPGGKGWCATVWVRYNGTLYKRARNVGPESHRTHPWMVSDE